MRAELLQPTETAKLRKLLEEYLDQRILFYDIKDISQQAERTSQLEADLWDTIREAAAAQPTTVVALVLADMNDVFKAQGHSGSRLEPNSYCCLALNGSYRFMLRSVVGQSSTQFYATDPVLPPVVAVSFLLIADIDTPRDGLIHVGLPWASAIDGLSPRGRIDRL